MRSEHTEKGVMKMDTKQIDRNAENIRIRHSKRQKQRRMMMKRRRIIFFGTLGLILLSIILFFTPLFNIKHINISGNAKVETADCTILGAGGEVWEGSAPCWD